MRLTNVLTVELDLDSSREGYRWRGLTFPFHFHHGLEEWLCVVAGEPTLRTPQGEFTLKPGEIVCFAEGPADAHSVRGPERVLILSDKQQPSISVYPDSDKLGLRPAAPGDRLNFRRADAVDYWDGG